MAAIENIEGQFFYVHNNYENAIQSLKNIDNLNITEREKSILENCIRIQKERENKVYQALGIDYSKEGAIPSQELYEKLYGVKIQDKNGNIDNKLDQALRLLNQFFIDMYTLDNDRDLLEEETSEKPTDAERIVRRMYTIKERMESWLQKTPLDSSQISSEDLTNIAVSSMNYWNSELKNSLSKEGIELRVDENGNLTGTYTQDELDKILHKYKGKAKDIFGGLSESGSQYFMSSCANYIIYSTSRWADEENKQKFKEASFNEFFKNPERFSQEYDVNTETMLEYKQEIEDRVKLIKENHSFGTPFFDIKVSSNPKADEIFAIKVENSIKPEFVNFGVSNKMGYTKNKSLKIQTTSLKAILSNAYLNDKSLLNDTDLIVKAITFVLINEAGVLNWSSGKLIQNSNLDSIIAKLVNTFAYIWLTGGDVDKTHADFFLLTKNGVAKNKLLSANTYFVSMSSILEKVLKNYGQSSSIFKKVAYNKAKIEKGTLQEISDLKSKKDLQLLNDKMNEVTSDIITKISKESPINISNYGVLL